MTRKKPAKKKEDSTTNKIPIITTIITSITVVIAAMISIWPKLLEINSQPEIEQQSTKISQEYVIYDDPLDLFSISLPSNLIAVERGNETSNVFTIFIPKEYNTTAEFDITAIDFVVVIGVAIQEFSVTAEDIEKWREKKNEELVTGFIEQDSPNVKNLIFNKKTSKGFFMKEETIESGSSTFWYTFVEWDKNTMAIMLINTTESSDPIYRDFISYAVSSFVWRPNKIIQHLTP